MPKDYRTFVYHADLPDGKIIILPDKLSLGKWLTDNPGWVQNPIDLPKNIADLDNIPAKRTVPEKPENMQIEVAIRDKVELLLSGVKVAGRVGLTLSSFCALYEITKSYTAKIEAKRPIYEAVLEVYKKKTKLWKHPSGRYYYWGINPHKKKKGKK